MIEANGVDHVMLRLGDVGGRPGQDRCIYFLHPDGRRLQLIVRS